MSLDRINSRMDDHNFALAKIVSLAEAVQDQNETYSHDENGRRSFRFDTHDRILNLLSILRDLASSAQEEAGSIQDDVIALCRKADALEGRKNDGN